MRFGVVDENQSQPKPDDHTHQISKPFSSGFNAKSLGDGGKKNLNTRCRHWPNCRLKADECEFVHPTASCKFFPNC